MKKKLGIKFEKTCNSGDMRSSDDNRQQIKVKNAKIRQSNLIFIPEILKMLQNINTCKRISLYFSWNKLKSDYI